ncbi:MAG: NAD(P)/FAD-dependent oxidoreductase [Acidobacteriota bacterium]|nr:NAD(P)/FAD-dependent oxidoreductase [Acidobacteriota bacterium]
MYDAIIVGGGPAGLSAALILGRCRRSVLVIDAGRQRNLWSDNMHGYLTRDGIPPLDFLETARRELEPYEVVLCKNTVVAARKVAEHFEVTLDDGTRHEARRMLLATGVTDRKPELAGIDDFYGKSVHHCPYCDGWENRDRPIAVYGRQRKGVGLAISLKTWSPDVVLCTDGPARLSAADRERLDRFQIPIRKEKILRLEGNDGRLERIVFEKGEPLERAAMFFNTGQDQASTLPQDFHCNFDRRGAVATNRLEGTCVSGLYVAGDASRDVQLVIVAAAEGAKAAFAINCSLQDEEHGT